MNVNKAATARCGASLWIRTVLVPLAAVALVGAAGTVVTAGAATNAVAAPARAATPTTPPAAYPGPGVVTGNINVHDPSVVKSSGGQYILVHTGANISIKTSADRAAWRDAGSVFPGGAPWTTSYTGGGNNLWAPDLSFHNGQFWLYYAASSFGSQNSAIFLATSSNGDSGTRTNQGLVISSSGSEDNNAIDPNLEVD